MNKKKLLALLMALVMTLTLVPVTAFAEGEVAEIVNGGQYTTLQAAIDNAQDGDTVKLLADINLGDAVLNIDKQLTVTSDGDSSFGITSTIAAGNAAVLLTGNGDVTFDRVNITSTKGHGIQAGKADGAFSGKLTFKNGTITVAQRGIRVYEKSEGFGICVENATIQSNINNPKSNYTTGDDSMGLSLGCTGYDVSIINSTIQGFSYCINVVLSGENLNVTMSGGETYGRAALNVWGGHNTLTLNGVNVHGINNQTGSTEGFACIVDNYKSQGAKGNNTFNVNQCRFTALLSEAAYSTETSTASQQMVDLRNTGSTLIIRGNTTAYEAIIGTETTQPSGCFGLMYNEMCISDNNVYLDTSAVTDLSAALETLSDKVIQQSVHENVDDAPVTGVKLVYNYNAFYSDGNTQEMAYNYGMNVDLAEPYNRGWMADGEWVTLQKDVVLTIPVTANFEGTGLMYLGDYSLELGEGGSFVLNSGAALKTDKRVTNVFSAPEGYKVVETNNGDGTFTYSVAQVTSAAQIGSTEYETLEAAFAAAVDGDTINVLADCAGNGIKAPQGKFGTNGLTVNFNGHTYTVDGDTVGSTGTETNGFQLLKDNKITFKNGTITSTKAKILVQNYSNLTLEGMTLTLNNPNYTGAYTLSNNNGNVVIDGTTITANPAGGFAFDVCRYSSYPSVSVTVQGNSVINGNIEFDAGSGDPKSGISLALNGGTHDGAINLTNGGKTTLDAGTNASITKASTFTQAAPEGYTWSAADTNGIQTLAKLPPWPRSATWSTPPCRRHLMSVARLLCLGMLSSAHLPLSQRPSTSIWPLTRLPMWMTSGMMTLTAISTIGL